MAQKSAANLIDAIEKSKSRDLNRLIYGLGIRHVGEHAAWIFANRFGSIERIVRASQEELTDIPEIGPVIAESAYNFFQNKENIKMLKKLKEAGLKMTGEIKKAKTGPLVGKNIVITGSLKSFSRLAAEEAVRKAGGNPSSSVSKNTDFLLAGEEPGSKLDKAKALAVKVIDEEEFKMMLKARGEE